MKYIMECSNENDRLEFQEKIDTYKIENDLDSFKINDHDLVLDAGCGAGTISRYLSTKFPRSHFHGCDLSLERINHAKELTKSDKIHYFQSSLTQIETSNDKYDKIICRFVYEYLPDPHTITKELRRVLKPGGHICLIDLDGMLFNLSHSNHELKEYLERIDQAFKNKYHVDLYVGRKLKSFLYSAGFKNIKESARTMIFQGDEIEKEAQNFRIRFENAAPMYNDILGRKDAENFKRLYIEELLRPVNTIFYNNFSVVGEK